MRKVTFNVVNKWAKQAKKPLEDEYLEQFQQDHFGEYRHDYYRFFYHMVAQMKPKLAIEIGVDHGHTLAHMAKANRSTKVLGIDKRMFCADSRLRELVNCEVKYIDSHGDEAKKLLDDYVRQYGKIGVIFQDSSHHYEASIAEWELYSQYLDKNAIWVCDDITEDFYNPNYDPPGFGMIEYWETLPGNKKLYKDLHYGTTIGVALIP